jgi:hypothetical protein
VVQVVIASGADEQVAAGTAVEVVGVTVAREPVVSRAPGDRLEARHDVHFAGLSDRTVGEPPPSSTSSVGLPVSTSSPAPPKARRLGPGLVVMARSFMSPSSALTACTHRPAVGNSGMGAVQTAECVDKEVHDPIAVIGAPGSVTVTPKPSAV